MTVTVTDSNDVKNGVFHPLEPPTKKEQVIQDKYSLILEFLWLNLLVLPNILLDLYRKVFPLPGKSLKGQIALVTGAGRGLGRGLALRLAREGCKVAVADVNRANAEDTVAEITRDGGIAKAYFTNVAKVSEVKELQNVVTKQLGPVDILVNNAGLIYGEPLEASTDEQIQAVIAVNLTSHFWMVREFLPSMKERNSGHIVAIASVAGMVGVANASAYVATKFGVRGFMEVVRQELRAKAGNNIKTTTVFPYFINTSAHYMDHWDIRFPAMTIEDTVEAIITGVKREEVSVTIPGYFYTIIQLMLLLPQYIIDKSAEIFYVRLTPTTKEEMDLCLTTALAKEFSEHEHK